MDLNERAPVNLRTKLLPPPPADGDFSHKPKKSGVVNPKNTFLQGEKLEILSSIDLKKLK